MTLKEMIFLFITIDMLLNGVLYAHTLIDSRCLCFSMVTKKTVEQNKLKWFPVPPQQVIGVMGKPDTINEIVKTHINVNKHTKICYFYIKDNNLEYNLILNKSWLNRNDVQIVAKEKAIYFDLTNLYVKSTEGWPKKTTPSIYEVNGMVYASWMRWARKQDSGIEVFAAFIIDIEKALHSKLNVDPSMLLPEHYCHKLKLFQFSEAEKLLLLQESGIDHRIELKQVDDKDPEAL